MEWLRNLAAESKARHLAAKQEEMKREKEERMRLEEAQAQAINNQRDSFLFRKTLVGYQGDLATIKDADENNKAVEESNIPTVSYGNLRRDIKKRNKIFMMIWQWPVSKYFLLEFFISFDYFLYSKSYISCFL